MPREIEREDIPGAAPWHHTPVHREVECGPVSACLLARHKASANEQPADKYAEAGLITS